MSIQTEHDETGADVQENEQDTILECPGIVRLSTGELIKYKNYIAHGTYVTFIDILLRFHGGAPNFAYPERITVRRDAIIWCCKGNPWDMF